MHRANGEWIWVQRKITSTWGHRPKRRWCGSKLPYLKPYSNGRKGGFNKWQWWGSHRKSIVKHIFTVPPLWSVSVVIKYSELGLNKCKAIKDFAVIYLFYKNLGWNNPVIQYCLLNSHIYNWQKISIQFSATVKVLSDQECQSAKDDNKWLSSIYL